ncbi:hypothetical protein EDB85DRAFT_1901760 [Lactarius pseudohatsudake]|nr:hypothetical protein EDB85DRAFT_1901760 [Lactarius pseudohatsudake]
MHVDDIDSGPLQRVGYDQLYETLGLGMYVSDISVAKVQFSAVQAPSPPNPNLNFVEFSKPELEPDLNLLNTFGHSPVIIVITVVADVQESAQTSVPKTVWHRCQHPTENNEICTIVSGQMYKKVLFLEQMLEVLQHVAKIPREQLEAIERGFQGDVTTKNLCDGPPTAMKGEKFKS